MRKYCLCRLGYYAPKSVNKKHRWEAWPDKGGGERYGVTSYHILLGLAGEKEYNKKRNTLQRGSTRIGFPSSPLTSRKINIQGSYKND